MAPTQLFGGLQPRSRSTRLDAFLHRGKGGGRNFVAMKLSHLALTVIEDPEREGAYHWLLLQSVGAAGVEEHSASEHAFPSAQAAFDAGAARWAAALKEEDEDADPVGDPVEPT